ncbi:GNAT family N-acetyltransferase [Desulfospira joergensenii]|uniref:GNAT family N-acetyltransferase n=1 Tax=Desulfospira joergensenii TaxID=53329 RepID=UPI0003B39510|nr:GNAT family N-acetyltransferase [Desulfospira joergensenii]
MDVYDSELTDWEAWLALAREVEPLFGPMADEPGFQKALHQAISENRAFCIGLDRDGNNQGVKGGIVISKESNEIAWLAVSQAYRKMGFGRKLIEFALGRLDQKKSIFVQTFDKSVPQGNPARKLYMDFGFTDFKDGGFNPAGVWTVIMKLAASKPVCK